MINSDFLNGMEVKDAIKAMLTKIEKLRASVAVRSIINCVMPIIHVSDIGANHFQ
jgi:hypothetical protein